MPKNKRRKGPKSERIHVKEHTRKRGKLPERGAGGKFKKKPKGGGRSGQTSLF